MKTNLFDKVSLGSFTKDLRFLKISKDSWIGRGSLKIFNNAYLDTYYGGSTKFDIRKDIPSIVRDITILDRKLWEKLNVTSGTDLRASYWNKYLDLVLTGLVDKFLHPSILHPDVLTSLYREKFDSMLDALIELREKASKKQVSTKVGKVKF